MLRDPPSAALTSPSHPPGSRLGFQPVWPFSGCLNKDDRLQVLFKLKWFVSVHLFSRCHYLEGICLYLLALSCAGSKGVSLWPRSPRRRPHAGGDVNLGSRGLRMGSWGGNGGRWAASRASPRPHVTGMADVGRAWGQLAPIHAPTHSCVLCLCLLRGRMQRSRAFTFLLDSRLRAADRAAAPPG